MNQRSAFLMTLASAACVACGNTGTETRTIDLAHLEPDQALELIEPYVEGGVRNVRRVSNPPALTIIAPSQKLDQIEELLRRYDVATPNVRLHFQVIEADGFTQSDSAIAAVETALRDLFRFRGYRLVADAMATGTSRTTTVHQLVGRDDFRMQLEVEIGQIATAEGRKAADLHVTLESGGQIVLQSGVTVPHGQTVVLGTARPLPNMGALILVVRPEIE